VKVAGVGAFGVVHLYENNEYEPKKIAVKIEIPGQK
jgi:hypothetical protein